MKTSLVLNAFFIIGLLGVPSISLAQDDNSVEEPTSASEDSEAESPTVANPSEESSTAENSTANSETAESSTEPEVEAAAPSESPLPARAQTTAQKRMGPLGSAKDKVYSKPLYFDQIDNGLTFLDPELVYDLETSQGQSLKMGDVELSDKTFFVTLLGLDRAHPQMKRIANSLSKKPALILRYPDKLISSGTFEMLSRTGDVLWATQITEEDRGNWNKKLEQWRSELIKNGAPAQQLKRAGLFATQFAVEEFPTEVLSRADRIFKFCLSSKTDKGSARLCSQWYGARKKGNTLQLALARVADIQPRVLVFNKVAALKSTVSVKAGEPVNFFAELKKGQSYEFIAEPSLIDLADITDTNRPNILKLIGFNTRPTQGSILLNPDEVDSFKMKIGFAETIGDFRKFWAVAVKRDDPHLFFPGQGGGVFCHRFELKLIPREVSRPYLRFDTPTVTYSTRPVVYGKINPGVQLKTKQNQVVIDSQNKNLFQWTLDAPERGKMNRSYLDVQFQGSEYRGYTEIFRSYSNEISGRFSGLATSSGFLLMGEVAYNKWFETLFGWDSYYLSRLRWGISTKYFQTFTPLEVSTDGTKANINVLTLDLKYRFSPGVWGREETLGTILSFQNLTYGNIKAPMLGVGAFWARSMPKVFDDLFNYLPFMNYPKFVDMEFIYYPMTTSSNVKLQGNFALNFHGKVHWTETLFGEAGFGVKRYAVQDTSLAQEAALNTFYGTVGLGLNF